MGRRSRRRIAQAAASRPRARGTGSEATPRPRAAASSGALAPERPNARRPKGRPPAPPPPWAPFPLVELAILVGLVLLVAGFLTHDRRGPVLLGCGLGLASLASLELTIREHFTGYRSHSTLLAGAGAVAVAASLYIFTRLAQPLPLVIAVAVFIALWRLLRATYRRTAAPPPEHP